MKRSNYNQVTLSINARTNHFEKEKKRQKKKTNRKINPNQRTQANCFH